MNILWNFFILLTTSFQLREIISISKSNIYTEFDSLIKFCGVVHVRQILHLENIINVHKIIVKKIIILQHTPM